MNNKYALYVNSNNRDIGGTNESFTITDTSGRFSVPPRAVKLTRASIPYTWQNITSSNNVFTITEAGPAITITVPPGNYSGTALATAITSAITASSATHTYAVVYNQSTGLFTISANGTFSLGFNQVNTIAPRIGFVAGTSTSPATSVTSTMVAILSDDNEIFICSNLVGGIDNGYDLLEPGAATNTQILAVAQINAIQNSTILFESYDDEPFFQITQSEWGKIYSSGDTTPRVISFFLRLPSGDTVNLQGYSWSAVLTFLRY